MYKKNKQWFKTFSRYRMYFLTLCTAFTQSKPVVPNGDVWTPFQHETWHTLNKTKVVHSPVYMTKEERETSHGVDLGCGMRHWFLRDYVTAKRQSWRLRWHRLPTITRTIRSHGRTFEKELSTHCLKAAIVFSRFSPAPVTEKAFLH